MLLEHEHVPPAGGGRFVGRTKIIVFVGRTKTTVFVGMLMMGKVDIGVTGVVSIAVGTVTAG